MIKCFAQSVFMFLTFEMWAVTEDKLQMGDKLEDTTDKLYFSSCGDHSNLFEKASQPWDCASEQWQREVVMSSHLLVYLGLEVNVKYLKAIECSKIQTFFDRNHR